MTHFWRFLEKTILIFLLGSNFVFAQDLLLERKVLVELENAPPEDVRRLALEAANQKISEEFALEFLGAEKFQKNRSVLLNKITKNSSRFIPFSKFIGPSSSAPGSFEVDLRISKANFRQLLKEQGLLSLGETAPVLLPLFVFQDQVRGKVFRWWLQGTDDFLSSLQLRLERFLRDGFAKDAFYVLQALGLNLRVHLPREFSQERFTREDYKKLGALYGAPLVLDGQVNLKKSEGDQFLIELKGSTFLTENGKNIGDVSRIFKTASGSYEKVVTEKLNEVLEALVADLSEQVLEAWQRGTISASTYRLTWVNYPSLKEVESLRDKLRTEFSFIRALRERRFSSQEASFEVESPLSYDQLAEKLQGLEWMGQKLALEKTETGEIRLRASGGGK